MFQTYEETSDPDLGPARLSLLRAEIARRELDGFVVPLTDAHQGEYVAPCDARLKWLTGFTGSAGFAVVLAEEVAIFVDGRYRLQVRNQVSLEHFIPVDWPQTQLTDWVNDRPAGAIGFDPWLHSVAEVESWSRAFKDSDARMVACDNLVDAVWADRPARPAEPVRVQPVTLAGESHADKRTRLAADLRAAGHSAAVITQTDSLCWLLNIRGGDIPRNPIVQGFGVLRADAHVDLFTIAPIADDVRAHLGADVTVHPRSAFLDALGRLSGRVRIDPATAPQITADTLSDPVHGPDPCALPKARKNAVEVDGARAAHITDGVAMVRFLHWLDGAAERGVTEIDAAKQLEQFRHESGALKEISFDTISSTGPNAAIVHYRVTEQTNRPLKPGELYLVDSGGQYAAGTTDVTRTIPVGMPNDTQRSCYTRVLQGLIALSRARFPRGVAGMHLDALARAPLWEAGLDFDHGTGHGVGSYLCVHEGPQRFSRVSDVPLSPGMILSVEPGYYRDGDFGIRLENLVVVREAPALHGQDDRPWLDLETLCFVPFERRLIDIGTLTAPERDWLDAYHAEVLRKIGPHLDSAALDWCAEACAPL